MENVNNSDENSILNFEEIFSMETSDMLPKQALFERKTGILHNNLKVVYTFYLFNPTYHEFSKCVN